MMSQYFGEKLEPYQLVSEMVPHFFIEDYQSNGKGNNKTSWDFNHKSLVSAIRDNAKRIEYSNFITKIRLITTDSSLSEQKKQILINWLDCIYNVEENLCKKLFSIIEDLDTARNENKYASVNFIISKIEENANHVKLIEAQEYITGIQYSSHNYIKLTKNANSVIDICHLNPSTNEFKFLPNNLNAYVGMEGMQYGLLYCENGDVFLINQNTLMACRRNQKWYCHDIETLKKLFFWRFEKRVIGESLLELAFNVSYKKRGGLLLYCPFKEEQTCIDDDILNSSKSKFSDSILNKFTTVKQNLFNIGKDSININNQNIELLADLMTLDGCIVIGKKGFQHIGGLIAFNDQNAKKQLHNIIGARNASTTYAENLNVISLKISQSGSITLFTKYYGNRIQLEFM